jgi:uncharacterized protein YukE
MQPGQVSVDQALFRRLDAAFDAASQTQSQAYARVSEVSASLPSAWSSEAAQPRFSAALQNWLEGFNTLQRGMNDMRQAMLTYARSTDSAEDDAIALSNF